MTRDGLGLRVHGKAGARRAAELEGAGGCGGRLERVRGGEEGGGEEGGGGGLWQGPDHDVTVTVIF